MHRHGPPRYRFAAILLAFTTALPSACVTVPDAVMQRTVDPDREAKVAPKCHAGSPEHVAASHTKSAPRTLDPARFRLMNWNAFKGEDADWLNTFAAYSDEQDLVTLQEAYLSDGLRSQLQARGLQWDLATAFRKQEHEAGVMTISRTRPDHVCVQRTLEPWLALPKSTLVSRFPLMGSDRSLLVANIHAVNFTLGTNAFRTQLSRLERVLRQHDGPVILAGDFNTWSDARIGALEETLVTPLVLHKVRFDPGHLKTVFEHNLDYVFYRDLRVIAQEAQATTVSDHNPMWVTFSAAKTGQ